MRQGLITPRELRPGSKIAIVSPATEIRPEYVEGARQRLESEGFRVVIGRHALGPADGTYACTEAERLSDLRAALLDPEIEAILCARGGYGCAHLLNGVSEEELRRGGGKWLIGFSDVSALHAMMQRAGVRSVHSSMAKHLTLHDAGEECNSLLLSILRGARELTYREAGSGADIEGEAEGILRGGNLAVLDGLTGTPFDMLMPQAGEDVILFIEDIGEAIYRTERMIRRLALAGALSRYRGIIAGAFTETRGDKNFSSTTEMLRRRLPEWGARGIPIAFDFPIGHIDRNLPMIEGSDARLRVGGGGVELTQRF